MFSIVEGGTHPLVLVVLLAVSAQTEQKFDDVDLLWGWQDAWLLRGSLSRSRADL